VYEKFKEKNISDITTLLGDYFDGLYAGDIKNFLLFCMNKRIYIFQMETI